VLGGGGLTGLLVPPPPEEVPEVEVVPVDDVLPSEQPVIVNTAAIAAIEVIRVVIFIVAASRNNPLVRELNLSCTNFDQGGGNSRLRYYLQKFFLDNCRPRETLSPSTDN
jgi:hypothetical protein